MLELPKVYVVVGPTASGKSAAGLGLARQLEGEVICADSRTIYRGMDIGTAKPVGERDWGVGSLGAERPLMVEGVPHWGVDLIEPSDSYSARDFQQYADLKIADILSRGRVPILVGGTGLYVRAVMDRPTFSEVEPHLDWRAEFAGRSLEDLLNELDDRDPLARESLDVKNRRRVERALEIVRATAGPLALQRTNHPPLYEGEWLGVDPGKEVVEERLEERLNGMVADGLVDEVRSLIAVYGVEAPGLQTIGYQEFLPFFRGETSLKEVLAAIRQHTKDYAKRQRTWWRKDQRITWFTEAKDLLKYGV
jgi:tRNA dimethylallyltransferase